MKILNLSRVTNSIISSLEYSSSLRNKNEIYQLGNELKSLVDELNHGDAMNPSWIVIDFGFIGCIDFPVVKMGEGSSLDLITIEDLILFSYYWKSRFNFDVFFDIGANIGLHSLIADKCGYRVISFEPASSTYTIGRKFLQRCSNNFKYGGEEKISAILGESHSYYYQAAVSNTNGNATLLQFVDNPYGNHLSGRKNSVYGEVKEESVKIISAQEINLRRSLVKIDAEGSDAEILESILSDIENRSPSIIFMCDWRDETREKIFNLTQSYGLSLNSPIDEFPIKLLIDLPKNNASDFSFISL